MDSSVSASESEASTASSEGFAAAALVRPDFAAALVAVVFVALDFGADVRAVALAAPWSSATASSTAVLPCVSVFFEEVVTQYLSYGHPGGPLTVNTTMTLSNPLELHPDATG
ncbi:hypothetical protein CITRIK5_30559 [Citricoccus sp. K5]|nr:hypothetical protein CITRIK5_30559 [Citricoccus sp. K5]